MAACSYALGWARVLIFSLHYYRLQNLDERRNAAKQRSQVKYNQRAPTNYGALTLSVERPQPGIRPVAGRGLQFRCDCNELRMHPWWRVMGKLGQRHWLQDTHVFVKSPTGE